MTRKLISIFLLCFVAVLFMADDGCDENNSNTRERDRQERITQEAQRQVGLPGVTNFTEKKLVRELYELRDTKIATFSYVMDMNGRLFHVCDSIGYGLPYGVQFTNPMAHYWNSSHEYELPQPEPNGLFMPPTAEGTWVTCAGPDGKLQPVYVEPRVVVSPFRLKESGTWIAEH